jgi:serine phosphatase RsbU (regulator of sigma subunit)
MARYILSGMMGQKPLRYELKPGVQTLGRSSACEIVLPDPAVSKQHAEIEMSGSAIVVRDLGSRNGTYVNDEQVAGSQVVTSKDTIRLGHLVLRVKDQEYSTVTKLSPESTTSESISTSIDEARTMVGEGRSDGLIGAVHEAGQLLSRRMEIGRLSETLIDLLERFVHADRILLIDGELVDGAPRVLASRVKGADPDEPLRMSRTMLSEVLEKKRSFLTKDATADDRFSAHESIISSGVHAAMAAPLFDNDRILGVVYVDSRNPLISYGSEELRLLTLLANMMAVKISNSRLEAAEQERERLQREIEFASRIQRNLLPQTLPDIEGYDIFAFQAPCHEVGGDLYDLKATRDGMLWLALGDVTGKGMGAALLMANAMAGLQILEEDIADPVPLVERLHKHVSRHVETGQFVTLFAGMLDPRTGTIRYVNAGHNPPVVVGNGGIRELESTGIPVALLPDHTWTEAVLSLDRGETLIVFSDGVTETTHESLQYDEGRWQKFLEEAGGVGSKELGKRLLADIEDFRGDDPIADDLTLLIIKRI